MQGCILITGASGFIGKAFSNHIWGKVKILTPTHTELDLTNYLEVKNYFQANPGIEQVIHCAVAPPMRYSERKSDDEYGKKIMADIAMAANVIRFAPKAIVLNTAVRHNLASDVGWSAELMSAMYSQFEDIIELSLYGVYGPGEDPSRFPSYCFKQLQDFNSITIKNNRPMSWIYIADLCRIIEYFSVKQLCKRIIGYERYDVVMPGARTMCQIATDCMAIVDLHISIQQTGGGDFYIGDSHKLLKELPEDFQFTEWEKGLKELYETSFLPKQEVGATTP